MVNKRNQNESLIEELIDLCYRDGVIDDQEREVIGLAKRQADAMNRVSSIARTWSEPREYQREVRRASLSPKTA